MNQVQVPVANGIGLQLSDDGKLTALHFRLAAGGEVAVALPIADLGRTISLLTQAAADYAAKHAPSLPPGQVQVTPVLANNVAFSVGRAPSESIVAFQIGDLLQSFAVDTTILHAQCRRLLSTTKYSAPETKQ